MEKITEKKEEAVIKLQAEMLEVKRKKGRVKNIKFELPTRDAFIINLKVIEGSILSTPIEELEQLTNYPERGEVVRGKIKDTINKAGEFFYAYLEDITFKKRKVGVKLKNIPPGEEETIKEQCNSIIKDEFILGIIEYFFEEQDKKKFRLPIPYLRDGSKLIGNNTKSPSLFSSNTMFLEESTIARDKMSKNTHILGTYFFMKFQNGERSIKIDNLSVYSEKMRVTNNEVKKYILALGENYALERITGERLTIENVTFFNTSFTYSPEDTLKIQKGITKKVGSYNHFYAYDCREESIIISPTHRLLEAINPEQKRGSKTGGFIYTAEEYFDLALELETDLAYKLLIHTATNKPGLKIGEDKLIKALGLKEQTRKQGRPRIRESIVRAFEELKFKGHIIEYNYNSGENMYSYSYSNKYVSHRIHNKKEG